MKSIEFNKSFEELMIFLQNEHVLNTMKRFISRNGLKINVRKFTSFFMIYYQKEELLDESYISKELFKQVKRTIKVYDSLLDEYKEFKLFILHYVVKETEKWFDIWKKKDKYELIMQMIHMYHHLEEQKKENNKNWNCEIDKQKYLIKTKIYKLDKSSYIEEFIQNPPRIKINEQSKKDIINVIHKAYWNNFQQSIKNKQWDQLIGFVNEIKTILKNLVPHRIDLHQEMDIYLDIEILKQSLENDMMSQTDIFKMMDYIINWIRQFQAPIDDKDTEDWYEHLKTLQEWDILMRDFFMITFTKLDKISNVLDKIKNQK